MKPRTPPGYQHPPLPTGACPRAAAGCRGAGARGVRVLGGQTAPANSPAARQCNPLKSNWIPPREQASNHLCSPQMFNYERREVFVCFTDYKKKKKELLQEGTGRKII